MIELLVYTLLLVADSIITWVNPVAGAFFTIALIFGNIVYLEKISNATKRRTIHEFLPALVIWAAAFLLDQWQDYAWGLLSIVILTGRLVDLSSRSAAKKRVHPRKVVRRVGPSAHRGRMPTSR
jgi:hypothetical protein